jgi:hypothetical protein
LNEFKILTEELREADFQLSGNGNRKVVFTQKVAAVHAGFQEDVK